MGGGDLKCQKLSLSCRSFIFLKATHSQNAKSGVNAQTRAGYITKNFKKHEVSPTSYPRFPDPLLVCSGFVRNQEVSPKGSLEAFLCLSTHGGVTSSSPLCFALDIHWFADP